MSLRTLFYSLAAGAVALFVLSTSTAIAGDAILDWSVDDSRSSIRFVSDAPMEKIVGTSEQLEGSLRWNQQDPKQSTATIRFRVDSMRTGNSTRDRHLTESDWLDADNNPYVTFELESLDELTVARSDNRIDYRGTATGTVELNGVTNEQQAQVNIAVLPERGIARIEPELEFRLADHDVKGASGVVGREVGEVIAVDGLIYTSGD